MEDPSPAQQRLPPHSSATNNNILAEQSPAQTVASLQLLRSRWTPLGETKWRKLFPKTCDNVAAEYRKEHSWWPPSVEQWTVAVCQMLPGGGEVWQCPRLDTGHIFIETQSRQEARGWLRTAGERVSRAVPVHRARCFPPYPVAGGSHDAVTYTQQSPAVISNVTSQHLLSPENSLGMWNIFISSVSCLCCRMGSINTGTGDGAFLHGRKLAEVPRHPHQ